MKALLSTITILTIFQLTAQNVGIGTNIPDASAKLHISDANRGLLIPNVSLTSTSVAGPVTSPATGLLVWNTNASVSQGKGVGYYYWNGTAWIWLITSSTNKDWSLAGNSGTNDAISFIGTTDNQDVVFRRNNNETMRLGAYGNVGIGASPLTYARLYSVVPGTDAINRYAGFMEYSGTHTWSTTGLYVRNTGSGNDTKTGLSINVSSAGFGSRFGINNSVSQNAASNQTYYGYRYSGNHYGPAAAYGYYGLLTINSSMNGLKCGIYSRVHETNTTGSTMSAYAGYFYNWVTSATSNQAIGIYTYGADYALYANGNTTATGTKAFSIDHPTDPENKVLKHFAIESNEVLNLYRGIAELDDNGEATVELPDYFEAININFTYSLTAIGTPVTPYILEEIEGNQFKVKGAPGTKVSWEVKANRNDKYIQAYPESSQAEVEKSEEDKGKYLRPELYGQPVEKGIHYHEPEKAPEFEQPERN